MKTHIRQKFIVGNWKMHTTAFEAEQLARGIIDGLVVADHVTVILCPPFPYLALVGDMLKGSQVALGAQNMYPQAEGAFTGEVSPTMLLDLSCGYVILGHSEGRHKLGESDEFINQKVVCTLAAGLDVILCVGETLEQRKSKQTEAVLDRQLSTGLAGVPSEALSRLSIAYEPVWAIGNDEHHATPQQAHDVHLLIRRKLSQVYGETRAQKMTVQYGGSVEPENAAAFLGQPGIDGVLIGGRQPESR
ncbi:triose-phosphate isomerase [Granulicella sp. 5B5]|uniref:triose-phosphate isomerase n=1 Tax=Granulicella sp. 5B5 TaxID=1617967 RepID=UPI001C71704D|nr:triose-phosphate isomerase [Granulicella sp. 5B5]